ncbi:MAG: RNA polymerase factor sigma-54 [Terrimicrobiaceae bacterium]|nr:RNA polymerase factor sigma-54 [Terrimicrobiaceae bacterium]
MAGFEQSLGLSLQQTLSPQMQQSLQVLQAPVLELRTLVEHELQVNPVLEEETPERESKAEAGEDWDDDLREISRLDEQWRDYMSQGGAYDGRSAEAQERREYLFNSAHTPKSLQQHLLDQLTLSDLDDEEHEVAEAIVGNLNEAGLLDGTVAELANLTNIRPARVEKVLREVQALDPVGVAARDLRECLLIQLERLGKRASLEARIVDVHLDDLLKRRFPEVARRLGVDVHDVQQAADFLSTLEPRPARQFSISIDQVIQPDVLVEKNDDGEFVVSLNNEHVPMLRISNYYKDLLSEPASRGQVRDYIRDKIKGGRFFIKCIQQRQQTILNIAREIVRRQGDFLREGPRALRPMTMNQVAQAVSVHETTVSRATNGKYIFTPQGILEMKYFFTPGYQTESGADISNESVRKSIAEVVEKEDKHRPLSDQAILEVLKGRGVPIARRTVAKYREQLGILPSHLRKTF